MKIKIHNFTFDDYRRGYVVCVDGKEVFSAYDGEPEDNSLDRNFNAIFSIPDIITMAYNAGINKEKMDMIFSDQDPDGEI